MPQFSNTSAKRLATCDQRLQDVANEAIKAPPYDFGITHGHRSVEEQKQLYDLGRTYPGQIVTNCDGIKNKSKHNYSPSKAFDIVVWVNGEINWDIKYYIAVGNHIMDIAKKLRIKIKWPINIGTKQKPRYDYPHFEIE